MTEKNQFTTGRVDYIYQASREISVHAAAPVKVGVRSVEVACKCGYKWTANERSGLRNVAGGTHITCPVCEAVGMLKL